MELNVSEDRVIDWLVKTVVYAALAFALLNALFTAYNDYSGVVYQGFFEVSGSSVVAVKATDPEAFRYHIAVKLVPSILAIWFGLYFFARMRMLAVANPSSLDFAGCHEPSEPERPQANPGWLIAAPHQELFHPPPPMAHDQPAPRQLGTGCQRSQPGHD